MGGKSLGGRGRGLPRPAGRAPDWPGRREQDQNGHGNTARRPAGGNTDGHAVENDRSAERRSAYQHGHRDGQHAGASQRGSRSARPGNRKKAAHGRKGKRRTEAPARRTPGAVTALSRRATYASS